jgi:hypothetical protein
MWCLLTGLAGCKYPLHFSTGGATSQQLDDASVERASPLRWLIIFPWSIPACPPKPNQAQEQAHGLLMAWLFIIRLPFHGISSPHLPA